MFMQQALVLSKSAQDCRARLDNANTVIAGLGKSFACTDTTVIACLRTGDFDFQLFFPLLEEVHHDLQTTACHSETCTYTASTVC